MKQVRIPTPLEKAQIVQRRKNGEKVSVIAADFNINPTTVHRYVRQYDAHGYEAFAVKHKSVRFSREQKMEVIEYHKTHSLAETVAKFGLRNETVVYTWRHKLLSEEEKAPRRGERQGRRRTAPPRLTKEEKQALIEGYLALPKGTMSQSEYADSQNVTVGYFIGLLQKYYIYGETLFDDTKRMKNYKELYESERAKNHELELRNNELEKELKVLKLISELEK